MSHDVVEISDTSHDILDVAVATRIRKAFSKHTKITWSRWKDDKIEVTSKIHPLSDLRHHVCSG